LFLLAAAIVFSARAAMAAPDDAKDLRISYDVAQAVNRYPYFSIFDDINVEVENGEVTLTGKVTMPFKRDEIVKRAAAVDGVRELRNKITVLPVSGWDDQLRYQVARAIYRNPGLANYGLGANPSIHIIVEYGRVTLTGVVNSEVDRMLARSVVDHLGALSVTNNLKTVAELRDDAGKKS
jgi:hyperosmotically inducible protein